MFTPISQLRSTPGMFPPPEIMFFLLSIFSSTARLPIMIGCGEFSIIRSQLTHKHKQLLV